MGILNHLFYPWSLLLQVFALIHFFRRRPDTYWLFIILFLGPLGALVYLLMEALPDIGLLGQSVKVFPRRKRIGELEIAIRDNPAPGNFEELGHLYMDDGKFVQARAAFDRAIAARIDTLDTFYRRGVCALQLGDYEAALPDLERAWQKNPITISIEPRDCWPTLTHKPEKRRRPKPCSARQSPSLHCRKRT